MGVQAVSCGGRPCRWSRWLRKGRRQATAPPSGARRPALAAGAPPRGRRVTAGRRAAAAASRAPGRWAATPPSRGSARCAPFPARPAPDRRRFWTGPAVADRERGGAHLSSPRVQRGHRRHVRRVEAPPLREAGAPLPPREAGPTRRTSIAGRGPTPPHPHPRPLPPRRGGRRLHVFFLFCGVGWGRARPISGRPPDASAKGAATFGWLARRATRRPPLGRAPPRPAPLALPHTPTAGVPARDCWAIGRWRPSPRAERTGLQGVHREAGRALPQRAYGRGGRGRERRAAAAG